MSSDKPPSGLSIPQPASSSSNTSSPRGLGATSLLNGASASKVKTPTGSNTPTSLPQVLPNPQYTGAHSQAPNPQYSYGSDSSGYMNSQGTPSYGGMEYHHHMSQGQPPTPQTATSGSSMSFPTQPPVLQPTYSQPHHGFQFPSFSQNGVSSSTGQPGITGPISSMHPSTQLLPLPTASQLTQNPSPLNVSAGGPQSAASSTAGGFNNHQFDTTGQVAPPGMKPRVAATLWEDEGSLCFQVEARGVCVARREDNHMINGTKLLNVAGMTRGRRDGILKSEKVRHVVKIGPMHLKGVWIPFERALDFANKEKITELLYPLFVHNIGAFLYHPTNTHRTNAVMAAAERRRADTQVVQQSQTLQQQQMPHMQRPSQAPPLHHNMHAHAPLHATLPPHQGLTAQPRPNIERSLSFPTPPSSASSVMGVNAPDGSSFWNQSMVSNVPGSGNQALAIDTVINSRSMPTTPATTPPGGPMQQLQQYPPPPSSIYPPNSSSMSQQNIVQQNVQRFNQSLPQPGQYMSQGRDSNNMGPPPTSRGPVVSRPSSRQDDGSVKDEADEQNGLVGESEGHVAQDLHGEEQADHDVGHEEEYTTQDGSYSNGHRSSGYYPPLNNDPTPHLSPEMNGSPGQNGQAPSTPARSSYSTSNGAIARPVDGGSGATPRTTTTPQQQWVHQSGFSTPPRSSSTNGNAVHPPPTRNLYTLVSGNPEHSETNGSTASDGSYSAQSGLGVSMPSQAPSDSFRMNGASTPSSNKRIREMDDDDEHGSRPSSRGHDERPGDADGVGLKRRKTIREGSTPSTIGLTGGSTFDRNNEGRLNRTRSAAVSRGRR